MALLGPMVVIAETPAHDLIDMLGKAGAFPIVEASWADAPSAIAQIAPGALALADPIGDVPAVAVDAVARAIERAGPPFIPILSLVGAQCGQPVLGALPVDADEPIIRLITRIRSALRVRTLHATVMRRAAMADLPAPVDALLGDKLLDDATVLCVGRGRAYPDLSVAVGERVRVLGALSMETAAHLLGARDIDGIVIGDGFPNRAVNALLTALAEDARFRDLPTGVLGATGTPPSDEMLPNLVRAQTPGRLVERLLPFVRLQALEGRLRRLLRSLEAHGLVDPETGLLDRAVFWRDLERAVTEASDRGARLSVARISFEPSTDRRTALDAARLLSRIVRDIDVACMDSDGALLVAFTETDLRAAHVVARRLAGVLRQGMAGAQPVAPVAPTVTLATLKPNDNLYSMMARVCAFPMQAAE